MGVPRIGQHHRADAAAPLAPVRAAGGTRHGLNAPLVRVNLLGFRAIDRRKLAARSAIRFRSELIEDLGGEAAVSAQERALIESAVRTWLYVQHLDAWLLSQTSLVNTRKKAAMPVLRDRNALAESLTRLLTTLGLSRRAAPAKSLNEVIAEIEAGKKAKAAVSAHVAPRGEQTAIAPARPPEPAKAQRGPERGADAGVRTAAVPLEVRPPSLVPEHPAYPSAPLEVTEPLELPGDF